MLGENGFVIASRSICAAGQKPINESIACVAPQIVIAITAQQITNAGSLLALVSYNEPVGTDKVSKGRRVEAGCRHPSAYV